MSIKTICFLLFLLSFTTLFAQKDSTWIGEAKGVLFDSAHNYVLSAATLAIYRNDTELISYQLTNNFGEFHFRYLPTDIPLTIIASYTGYKNVSKKIIIYSNEKSIDLKKIYLEQGVNELKDVIVTTIPPVRMNGDTLEFNADAFKLDKNAVAEDLLRKLPGVIVWGDGTITVNGKQVNQLFVEGKPFFGGDTKIATQNIAKNAIDKIQVYQQAQNPNNPFDSITNINIKLKKDKNFGHFGKLSFGYGTDKRFESDANINFFTPSTQLGFVGASNNINKMASDATTLMRNSTYKGVGASVEYQPNLSEQGVNQFNAAGLIFQKDFIPPNPYKTDRLTINYFLNNNHNTTDKQTLTTTTLGGNNIQLLKDSSDNRSVQTSQFLNAKYERHIKNYSFKFTGNVEINDNNSTYNDHNISSILDNIQSTNAVQSQSHTESKNISLEAYINHQKELKHNNLPGNWTIDYAFNTLNNSGDNYNTTNFASLVDNSQSRYFNRKYDSTSSGIENKLDIKLADLSKWIFGNNSFWEIQTEIENQLDFRIINTHSKVTDRDTGNNLYVENSYLTNNTKQTIIDENPCLNFSKTFFRILTSRYQKTTSVNLYVREQFYSQNNNSDHLFQNFNKAYQKFVPQLNISYNDYQFSNYNNTWFVNYASTYQYPTVAQLFPLVDSSNIYYLRLGNPLLKPSNRNEVSLSFQHNSFRTINTFNYNIQANIGTINNNFSDSSIIDSSGRGAYYTVNLNGYKYVTISGNLNKAFKMVEHQIQINLIGMLSIAQSPNYIKNIYTLHSIKNISNIINTNNKLSLYYTFKDILAFNISEGWNWYHSKQDELNNTTIFINNNENTAFSASVSCTKKLTISSNITYNHTTSTGTSGINFTIWNANATYRFLQGNNLELKLAALDLLHQNKGIINTGSNYTITHGMTNVLQQYFMLTLSYFPRQFGKHIKKETN